jgi:hypothetical protein
MTEAKKIIGQCTIKNVRLGFPFLFERGQPQKRDDGTMTEGNFRASGIMYRNGKYKPYTDANLKLLTGAKKEVLTAKFGPDEKKWPKIKPDKICVRDGNLENWDGFEDSWYVSASENTQPVLLSRRKDAKGIWIPATKAELYAGCFVNMIVQLWLQDNAHGMRVNANLKAVQYFGPGEAFAGSAPIDPSQAFTDVDEEDEGDIGGGEDGFGTADDDDDSVI